MTFECCFSLSQSKLGMWGGHWGIAQRNHCAYVYATLSLHRDNDAVCLLLGFSPSGQKANRTRRLRWPKTGKKKSLTVTSLQCCCCYVDKEICKHCFLLNYKFNFNIFPIKYARSSTFFCSVQLKPTHAVIHFCPKQWKQASGGQWSHLKRRITQLLNS